MANKNRNLIIAYFPSKDKAETAADDLKKWDKDNKDIKLGGIGIITEDEDGNLKTRKVGMHAAGTGAKWDIILGAAAGILSGGITIIGGAIAGLAGGAVAGALFHKKIGMEDADKERLLKYLKDGGAALAVMADDDEVEPTKSELSSLGGEVESYVVPEDTIEELEVAAAEEGIEEQEELIVAGDDDHVEKAAVLAATAVVADEENGAESIVEETAEIDEIVVEDEDDAAAKAAAAAVIAAAVADDEENGEDIPRQAILHFKRYNGDYDDWGLHVWTGYYGEIYWDNPLPPTGSDDFGIYFTVPIAEGAEGLGYIIHRGDEKDQWDDQYLNFDADGYEVWIVQNMPGYVAKPE